MPHVGCHKVEKVYIDQLIQCYSFSSGNNRNPNLCKGCLAGLLMSSNFAVVNSKILLTYQQKMYFQFHIFVTFYNIFCHLPLVSVRLV